jgi:hypothetical protein
VIGDTLAVYDRGLSRVTLFRVDGAYIRSFPVATTQAEHFGSDGQGGIVLTQTSPEWRGERYRLTGELRTRYALRAAIDSVLRGELVQSPGALCGLDTLQGVLFANPWIEELVWFNDAGEVRDARYWPGASLHPMPPDVPNVFPVVQRSVLLGLACTADNVVLGYLDRVSRRIVYDFFTSRGRPLARHVFDSRDVQSSPGTPAAVSGSRLVTFRSRPFPQVFVFRVTHR